MRILRAPLACWLYLAAGIACLLLGAVLIYCGETQPFYKWLMLSVLALPSGSVILLRVLGFFTGNKCESCGFYSYDRLDDFDECPCCGALFSDLALVMPKDGLLRLHDYLSNSRPMVKLVGMILTLAIRDAVNEVRFEGRDEDDESLDPWDESHRRWRIWLSSKGEAYETVPPPRHVGTNIFLLLKEIRQRTERSVPNGPARFQIVIDDYSESVKLVIEESAEEEVAKFVFTSESLEPWEKANQYLEEIFSRCEGSMSCCASEGGD